jgi:hypothetical protein
MPGDSRLRNKIHQAITLTAVRLIVTQFSRMIVLGLVLLVACVFLGYWILWGPEGDPGGRVLTSTPTGGTSLTERCSSHLPV